MNLARIVSFPGIIHCWETSFFVLDIFEVGLKRSQLENKKKWEQQQERGSHRVSAQVGFSPSTISAIWVMDRMFKFYTSWDISEEIVTSFGMWQPF